MAMLRLMRYTLVLCTLLLATLTAQAADRGGVKCSGVVNATHISTGGMNLWLEFENDSSHTVVVKSGEVQLYIGDRYVMTISLRDKVVIPRCSRSEVLLPLRFTSSSNLKNVVLLRKVMRGDEDVSVSYKLRAGTRLIKRTFRAEDVALSEIFDNFAISDAVISEFRSVLE